MRVRVGAGREAAGAGCSGALVGVRGWVLEEWALRLTAGAAQGGVEMAVGATEWRRGR